MTRLFKLTKNLKTVEDVANTFGEPDIKQPVGWVKTTIGGKSKPDTTQNYPMHRYNNLSKTADVLVLIFPKNQVAIKFQEKPIEPGKKF